MGGWTVALTETRVPQCTGIDHGVHNNVVEVEKTNGLSEM